MREYLRIRRPRPQRGLLRARRYPAPRRLRFSSLAQFTVGGWLFLIVAAFGTFRPHEASLPTDALAQAPETQQVQALDISRGGNAQRDVTSSAVTESTVTDAAVAEVAPDDPARALEQLQGFGGEPSDHEAPQQEEQTSSVFEPIVPEETPDPNDASTSLGVTQQYQPTPIYREHVVQEGETVSDIATRYGVWTQDVVWNNADVLEDADLLLVGATLQVPGTSGVIHSVRLGETVSEIAERYDAEVEDIVNFEANGFNGNADNLIEGSMILVPGGQVIPPEPIPVEELPEWVRALLEANSSTEQPAPAESSTQEGAPPVQEPEPQPQAEPEQPAAPPPPAWQWPATGRLTSLFGPRHPLGIDISMVVDTPIVAASAGQVIFTGGNACCSYGYHIIIRHADGHETLYAHLSKFEVANGQWVETGQLIGRSGNTGYSTGPHLHFEIRLNGAHRDPLGYLP